MTEEIKRSPLFYVGDKYRLMNQLVKLFPRAVNNYYEPFVGGGTAFLNVRANKYYLNDIDVHLVEIHKHLMSCAKNPGEFFADIESVVLEYNLSRSFKEDIVPNGLKQKYKKTYYARFNRDGYEKLRECVNSERKNDPLILYILLIYGFNRMLRFNRNGDFNLPVGNVDFNRNVVAALHNYFSFMRCNSTVITSWDFRKFVGAQSYGSDDFLYFDPPYLIAASEYNKLWGEQEETALLETLDGLNEDGVRFALSNVISYNGKENAMLMDWMRSFRVHAIDSNYISYHHNGKKQIQEVLVTNY